MSRKPPVCSVCQQPLVFSPTGAIVGVTVSGRPPRHYHTDCLLLAGGSVAL